MAAANHNILYRLAAGCQTNFFDSPILYNIESGESGVEKKGEGRITHLPLVTH
jgi:hypothetical protein